MSMRSSNPFGAENAREVYLYDLSINPVELRAENKLHFKTFDEAAKFLGVHRHKIARGIGDRVTSLKDGKEYALREPKKESKKILKHT